MTPLQVVWSPLSFQLRGGQHVHAGGRGLGTPLPPTLTNCSPIGLRVQARSAASWCLGEGQRWLGCGGGGL